MDLNDGSSAPAAEADDLRASLSAAFEAASSDPAPASPPAEVTPAAEPAASDTPAADRVRDAQGRFAPTAAEKAATEAAAKPAEPAKPATETPPTETPPATDTAKVAPPPGWSPTAKAEFANLPPSVREAVAKREEEVNKGLAQLAEYKDLKPYAERAKAAGRTLAQEAQRYAQAEENLAKAPVPSILHLCRTFGVTPAQLVEAAGGAAPAATPAPATPARPAVDPEVARLRSEIDSIKTAPLVAQVDAFFADTTNYPYAANLRGEMGPYLADGRAKSLPEAYEMAAWANPETRALLIKQQSATRDAEAAAARTAAASNARASSKSVTGSPHAGASTTPDMSDLPLRDQLRAAFNTSRA